MLQAGSIFKLKELEKQKFIIEKSCLSGQYGKNFRSIFIVEKNERWHNSIGMLFGLFKKKIVIVKELWKEYKGSEK
jgi:hypothetical protein